MGRNTIPEADYLYTDESQLKDAGKGLFTAIQIYKGETIARYKGRELSEAQIEKSIALNHDQYFMKLPNGGIFDTKQSKGFAKYANDAEAMGGSAFKNNAQIGMDESENICLIAKKNIRAGEEIFCSYGKNYWKKHGQ